MKKDERIENEITLTLGQRLKMIMKSKKLSVIDLVKLTGVSKNAIYDYLADTHKPSYQNLIKLCKGLKVEPTWLLDGSEV